MKNRNVVVKKEGHSRVFLSGIYNACRYPQKEKTLLNECVEDPRQNSSGMTPNLMGFTLIELLVVVLIIGILAAVALPQYNKAVWKARMANVLAFGANAEKALDLYMMENNPGDVIVDLTGLSSENTTGIDLLPGLSCNDEGFCWDSYFRYRAGFDYNLYWQAFLLENPVDEGIDCSKHTLADDWDCTCSYETLHGKWMCDMFNQSRGGTVSVRGEISEPDTETPPEP